jgi:hypothetical protein
MDLAFWSIDPKSPLVKLHVASAAGIRLFTIDRPQPIRLRWRFRALSHYGC